MTLLRCFFVQILDIAKNGIFTSFLGTHSSLWRFSWFKKILKIIRIFCVLACVSCLL